MTTRMCHDCACAWDGPLGQPCWNCGSLNSTFYHWPNGATAGSTMPRESWSLEELAA